MSVLKNLRLLSEMQFYKTAITIRKELTIWLLKDFGTRRNAKSVNQVIKDITPKEQAQIDGIMYPTEIDNYCKIVRGCKYYGRYMDDTYIIHPDKKRAY